MTRKEHLLTILSEECSETAPRASKAIRFGLTEIQPGQPLTNTERLINEFNDMFALMEMLRSEGCLDIILHSGKIEAKKLQVEHYLKHSKECGTLTE